MINHIELIPYKDKILGIGLYGSRLYGNHQEGSDHDYLVIINDSIEETEILKDGFNFHIISKESFSQRLQSCEIVSLEVWFSPKTLWIDKPEEKIEWANLRPSISEKSSHSFVKAKKKIEVEKDVYVGQKSLWHALRILQFGIQLAKHKKVLNFAESNLFFEDIKKSSSWEDLKIKYQPIYNQLKSEFKKICPKS